MTASQRVDLRRVSPLAVPESNTSAFSLFVKLDWLDVTKSSSSPFKKKILWK
jgi:hypothetical protein